MGTLDGHLSRSERKTGKVVRDVAVGDPKNANVITMAPPRRNKVIGRRRQRLSPADIDA